MSSALVERPPWARAVLAASLRAIWFGLIPIALTALALRYLLQSPVRTPAGALRQLAEWADQNQVAVAIGFFLLFSALLRYWRFRLPAAKLWAEPPAARRSAGVGASLLWMGLIVLAGAAALGARASLVQSYRVLSGSMLPTLQPGDLVLSTQYAYGARWPGGTARTPTPPRRGDVVVFRRPPIRPDVPEELIKRVIGLPGDTITTNGGYALINGWKVPTCMVGAYVFIAGEGMLEARVYMEFLDDKAFLTAHGPWEPQRHEPYTVKPGEVFVLGDNRNNSSDSRAWNEGRGGGLRFEEIRGRVDRFLSWTLRSGSWDSSALLQPIGLQLRTEGIDDSELRAGIARCLKERPKETRPPRPASP